MKPGTAAKLLTAAMLTGTPLFSSADASVSIFQTTREGDRLATVAPLSLPEGAPARSLKVDTAKTYQTLIGIGGSFTESGAQVLYELSEEQQAAVFEAYFSPEGAHLSLTRTHVASCDFSVRNYTYAPVAGDVELEHFTIEADRTYLLPMIKSAQAVEGAQFKIMASPWTAPPWMKSNQTWNGGELLPEHYGTFADYMVRYIKAYADEGIPIWAITPVNEPLGNGANWESLHFDPEQMRKYIGGHLGPALEEAGLEIEIWIYDQNREELMMDWVNTIMGDPDTAQYVHGTAVHWYQSTVDVGGEVLDKAHAAFPEKGLLHSEGCIDAMGDDETIGVWLEDDWYWRPEATDWGYIWTSDELKPNHPPYRPFYRYARDLIGGFNHHLSGWIDWNLLLNTRGGPNHARNYCLAPILVDSGKDFVYKTPLYYAMAHASKFLRPGAVRVGLDGHDDTFMATAFVNPDASLVLLVFNTTEEDLTYAIEAEGTDLSLVIPGQALQTVVLKAN
jgi:glucosylceramidase